jgi:amino acid transporter
VRIHILSKLLHSDAQPGSLFTSARVVYAAARAGQLPRAIGVLDVDRGTPIRAVLLQAAITIALILLGGGFRALVRIAVVALWAFYFLTVRLTVSRQGKILNIVCRFWPS